jgi:carboxymethylenebutenolidase
MPVMNNRKKENTMGERFISIQTTDGTCEAFLCYPDLNKAKLPSILLYMDAIGVRPAIEDMARKLASKGYLVLLPNLFYRQGKIPVLHGLKDKMGPEDMGKLTPPLGELIPSLTPEMLLKDAADYLNTLSHHEFAQGGKVALVGYCFGGAHAVRTAAAYPEKISLVASFHGGNLASDKPNSPHLLLSKVKAELYFAHADKDKSMPAEQIERLESALEENQNEFVSEIYPGANHGFTMRDLPAYHQEACDRHWNNLFSLLEKNY